MSLPDLVFRLQELEAALGVPKDSADAGDEGTTGGGMLGVAASLSGRLAEVLAALGSAEGDRPRDVDEELRNILFFLRCGGPTLTLTLILTLALTLTLTQPQALAPSPCLSLPALLP
mmetsp:Transcript_29272/g.93826  ORF Transcript_29272/g.93826 Transcript_29272/m.93826 type:complete len:117 (+) Transcript_29272:140-490(+)